jgi:hypothetical protein
MTASDFNSMEGCACRRRLSIERGLPPQGRAEEREASLKPLRMLRRSAARGGTNAATAGLLNTSRPGASGDMNSGVAACCTGLLHREVLLRVIQCL